jgi:uncharacterized protein YkwD
MQARLLLLILLLSLPVLVRYANSEASTGAAYCLQPVDKALLESINDWRSQNDLHPLASDALLGAAARHHSADMAATGYFAHWLSDGTSWDVNIWQHGYRFTGIGENLAKGQLTAEEVVADWIASPGHNANLLEPYFYAVGLALVINPVEPKGYYWTITLGHRQAEPAEECPEE